MVQARVSFRVDVDRRVNLEIVRRTRGVLAGVVIVEALLSAVVAVETGGRIQAAVVRTEGAVKVETEAHIQVVVVRMEEAVVVATGARIQVVVAVVHMEGVVRESLVGLEGVYLFLRSCVNYILGGYSRMLYDSFPSRIH